MKKEVVAHKNPKSPISEVFRTLRTNIQFMNTSKKMKTLLVTSTFPGEGKSWVTANLAVTFAQAGKKVILIDADMRKGRQYAIFGASPKPGLSNYLSQSEIDENGVSTEKLGNYIQETEVQNLYLISAGNVPPNPSELLVSAQMVKLLDELKEMCDIVMIDGTPCELVADSIILSRLVDSTLIVTAHKKTKKDALDRVIKNIKNVGGNLAGVVLNKFPVGNKKYGERYYYYGDIKQDSDKNKFSGFFKKNEKEDENESEQVLNEMHQIGKEKQEEKEINQPVDVESVAEAVDNIQENKNMEKDDTFMQKTNEILKQINDYIDSEKKKMK